MVLPEPPTGEPRQVLQAIWDHALATGTWPSFAQLDHRWDTDHESDVLDVLRQLRPGFTYGDDFRNEPSGSTAIGLTVAGAHCCHGAGPGTIRLPRLRPSRHQLPTKIAATRRRPGSPTDHHRPGLRPPSRWTARRRLPASSPARPAAHPFRTITLDRLGGPNSEGHWQASLHRNIRRFRNVTTLDEYWEIRRKSWEPSTPDPAEEEPKVANCRRPPVGHAQRSPRSTERRAAYLDLYGG